MIENEVRNEEQQGQENVNNDAVVDETLTNATGDEGSNAGDVIEDEEPVISLTLPGAKAKEETQEGEEKNNVDVDWRVKLKEEVKAGKLSKKEILELIEHQEEFELDEWEKNFLKHTRNGGSREDYLKNTAIDWNSVPDDDFLFEDAKKLFPNKTEEQIAAYLDDKYGTSEDSTEREKRLGAFQKEVDADKLRKQRIAESEKYKIKELEASNAPSPEAEIAKQEELLAKTREWISNLDDNKNLVQNKKISIKLENVGDNKLQELIGEINLKVDNPQLVIDFMNDANIEKQLLLNEKGEPDIRKAQMKALLGIMGTEKFVSHFVNIGYARGLKKTKDEARNIGSSQQQRVAGEKTFSHNAVSHDYSDGN